jgi:nucleoside-diphosphate-sugar epimerase
LRIEHDLNGPTIATSFALDNRRAKQVLGWQPQVSFDDGVRRTLGWWRSAMGGGAD